MRSFQEYTKEPLPQKKGTLAEELTKQISEAYNGKSNLEMMRNILAEAEKGKREGTLSNEEIDQFYQTFSPMLDGIQRVYLRQIIDELKKI